MNIKVTLFTALFTLLLQTINAQTGIIEGIVTTDGQPTAFAQVIIETTTYGATTNHQGKFTIDKIPFGSCRI